jgi:hypothetical protein
MKCHICGGSKYTDALKKYNAGKSAWCLPRKGTTEYKEVLDLIEKPKRKLRPKTGQAPQKRIEDFTPIQSVEMEEKPKRKLKPRVPVVEMQDIASIRRQEALKRIPKKATHTCPICNKEFINLEEHITKSHNTLVFQIHKDGAKSTVKAFENGELLGDGEVSGKNVVGTLFWSERQDGEIAGQYNFVKDEFTATIHKEAEPKRLKNGTLKYYKPKTTPLHKGYKVEYV